MELFCSHFENEWVSEWAKPYPAIPCLSSPFYSSWWLLSFSHDFTFISYHTSIRLYIELIQSTYIFSYYNIQPAAGEQGEELWKYTYPPPNYKKYIHSFLHTFLHRHFTKNFQPVIQPITIQQCHCYPKTSLGADTWKAVTFLLLFIHFSLGACILFLLYILSAILFQSYSILLCRFHFYSLRPPAAR